MKRKTQDPRIAQKVIEMVAAYYKTTPEALKDENGDRKARQVVMYTLKEELGAPLRTAREVINVKSDPTVYAAVDAVKPFLKTDTALVAMIEEIKTEALMIAAMPSGTSSPSAPTSTSRQSALPSAKGSTVPGKPETAPIITSGNTTQVIGNVQKAVTGVFLGADLLQSRDPAAEVMLAKDAVVFLVWDDFPKITLTEILGAFHLDLDSLYRAIGRISVSLREDGGELKKKLKAARGAYSQA